METNIKQKVGMNFIHNKMELIPDNDCEIVHEDGKWYVVRKPKKYPKTLEECCDILGIELSGSLKYSERAIISYKIGVLACVQELLICRDAYWKIAGDWKPDWADFHAKHCIIFYGEKIRAETSDGFSQIISFPTAEMRDAFYENFKDLIESCKELL